MRRVVAVVVAGAAAAAVAGCGVAGPSETAALRRSGALIEPAPTPTLPVTEFVAGETVTRTLPTGQVVTMTVNGPLLTNPIAGQKVQFANVLTETFTVTASTTSTAPVTLAAADFALQRFGVADAVLNGPATTVLSAATPARFTVALEQTPGQGYFVWRYHGAVLAKWVYVAEND